MDKAVVLRFARGNSRDDKIGTPCSILFPMSKESFVTMDVKSDRTISVQCTMLSAAISDKISCEYAEERCASECWNKFKERSAVNRREKWRACQFIFRKSKPRMKCNIVRCLRSCFQSLNKMLYCLSRTRNSMQNY